MFASKSLLLQRKKRQRKKKQKLRRKKSKAKSRVYVAKHSMRSVWLAPKASLLMTFVLYQKIPKFQDVNLRLPSKTIARKTVIATPFQSAAKPKRLGVCHASNGYLWLSFAQCKRMNEWQAARSPCRRSSTQARSVRKSLELARLAVLQTNTMALWQKGSQWKSSNKVLQN